MKKSDEEKIIERKLLSYGIKEILNKILEEAEEENEYDVIEYLKGVHNGKK